MADPRERPLHRPQPSVRRRLANATLVVVLVLVAATVAVGLSVRDVSINTDAQVSRYNPARISDQKLLSALLNQESGLRGYLATSDEQFLAPYTQGLIDQNDAVSELSRLVGDDPRVGGTLRDLLAAVDDWHRQTALARIAQVKSGHKVTLAEAQTDRARFDLIRDRQTSLDRIISAARDEANSRRVEATRTLERILVLIALFVLILVLFSFRATNRWVVSPMLRLRDEARIVAAGDFGHEVAVDGPREIRELADDIEAMRLRITDELSEVVRARTELAEKAAALEQSNTDLEQFAYVASHDLQEPLRKVSNFCQLLERQYSDQLDDRALQYIGFAVDGARRMQALIQDLLAFSRVGRTTEGFEPVDLEAVAVEARATLENEIEEAGATVTIDPDLPTVEGDSGLLATLFQNLIGNAVKYRSEQPPAVSLTYEGVVEGMHRIAVADNGIGIDPAYADRIFVIFQRLHVRDAYSGTGIGLAICKKIVEYHSGRIWLDPEPTEGARFWLALPVGAVDEQDVQHDIAGASG